MLERYIHKEIFFSNNFFLCHGGRKMECLLPLEVGGRIVNWAFGEQLPLGSQDSGCALNTTCMPAIASLLQCLTVYIVK